MRTRIKISDLTIRQWDWLQDNLPDSPKLSPDAVRVCVEFELSDELLLDRHVEMTARMFVALMTTLSRLETAQAALTPDELPDHLEAQRNAEDPQRAAERADGPPLAEVHDPATGRYTVDPDRA
jgi:hypothetical protein